MKKHKVFLIFYAFWVSGIVLVLSYPSQEETAGKSVQHTKACAKSCQKIIPSEGAS